MHGHITRESFQIRINSDLGKKRLSPKITIELTSVNVHTQVLKNLVTGNVHVVPIYIMSPWQMSVRDTLSWIVLKIS